MPRQARKQAKVRLNLDLPEEVKERLEVIREQTHADSMSEVIRRALAVYDFLSIEKLNGATLIVRGADGSEKQLELL